MNIYSCAFTYTDGHGKLGGNGPFKDFMRSYSPAEQGGYREGMSPQETYHSWAATQYREKVRVTVNCPPNRRLTLNRTLARRRVRGKTLEPLCAASRSTIPARTSHPRPLRPDRPHPRRIDVCPIDSQGFPPLRRVCPPELHSP